ncbi:MAG TPA: tyrosine-type recombinase/integrase [Acidimicrobiales bacterium]|nr:tyrosine-type recombinase/integrase [Acidimicrobiales bacterium]
MLTPVIVSERDRNVGPSRETLVRAWSTSFRPDTRRNYALILADYFRFLDDLGIHYTDVRRSHVELWGATCAERRHNLPATVSHKLSAVRSFYGWLLDEELVDRDPTAKVKLPNVADDIARPYLSLIELMKCLDVSQRTDRKGWHRDYALFALLGLNGLRISEALGVNIETIEDLDGHHTVRTMRKGQKVATIPLSVTTYKAVSLCVGDRRSGPLFRSDYGTRMDRYSASRVVQRVLRAAGVSKHITPHSLRRTFITLALDAGVPLRDVQHSAGHSDPRVTSRYDQHKRSLDRNATFVLSAHVAS